MEELINYLTRNKATYFNIKDAKGRRVAYVEAENNQQAIEAFALEYAELPEGSYVLGCWKGSKNAGKSILERSFKVGELSQITKGSISGNMATGNGNQTLQQMLAAAKEEGRREASLEMRIIKIEDFISEDIKPMLKVLKELAELDIKVLREGIESLKNDDPDDDDDAIEKLEKLERGTRIVKSLMSKSA
jgi:hypothetical protein